MGDFVSQNNDVLSQERLQRRLEGYRKHHSNNKIHYDNYANAEYEKINEDTKVLHQKWLDSRTKKPKAKSTKAELIKDSAQIKPKPKVNAVKPIVITPTTTERSSELAYPASSFGLNVPSNNESQKQQQSFINASNTNGNSVQVNINLDANLAQSQNGITVHFSSRITGNNVALADSNSSNNFGSLNVGGNNKDESIDNQPCKSESNDLSLCDETTLIDNIELDHLLGSGPVDDGPIDFEFFNDFEDLDSIPQMTNSLLQPNNEEMISAKGLAASSQIVPSSSLPNIQETNFQQKTLFQNQIASNVHPSQNFPQIELNISSNMSKFSSILGETTGPAAETLKHLAAKHNNQEKVQQQIHQNNMMYQTAAMKPYPASRSCYQVPQMPAGGNVFGGDPASGNSPLMAGAHFKLSYSASQCQELSLENQSAPVQDGAKGKAPPCYQEVKPSSIQKFQTQVQQQSHMQFTQKLSTVNTVREADVNFDQYRLLQENQQMSMQVHSGSPMLGHGQVTHKMYPNGAITQVPQGHPHQYDCLKMQQQQKAALPPYQRHHPYAVHGHNRFANVGSNATVPLNFMQNQPENELHSYKLGMNNRQQMCAQQQQQPCNMLLMQKPVNYKHPTGVLTTHQLPAQHVTSTKEVANMDGLKGVVPGTNEMISSCYTPGINMAVSESSLCRLPVNLQHKQLNNSDMFYNDNHLASYSTYPSAGSALPMRSKWNCGNVPPTYQMPSNKSAMSHLNYPEMHQSQNCYADGRSYGVNGNHLNSSYQFSCNSVPRDGQFYHMNQDNFRMMQYNMGSNMTFEPQKQSSSVMHQNIRIEGFGYQ